MTKEQRQARFIQDIQKVLDQHNATILVTDDHKIGDMAHVYGWSLRELARRQAAIKSVVP